MFNWKNFKLIYNIPGWLSLTTSLEVTSHRSETANRSPLIFTSPVCFFARSIKKKLRVCIFLLLTRVLIRLLVRVLTRVLVLWWKNPFVRYLRWKGGAMANCRKCGARLSMYNKTGKCFCHSVGVCGDEQPFGPRFISERHSVEISQGGYRKMAYPNAQ